MRTLGGCGPACVCRLILQAGQPRVLRRARHHHGVWCRTFCGIRSGGSNFSSGFTALHAPVLLTSPAIRPFVRSIVERFRPMTTVMSQNEIHPKARIKTVGQI